MTNQLLYKYVKIDLTQFAYFEENYDQSITEIEFQTNVKFSFDKVNHILCCIILLNMLQNGKYLVKAEVKNFFDIEPNSLELLRNNGNIIFTPDILVQFASFSYGSLRGILHVKTEGTVVNQFILPPVYMNKIITNGFEVQ